MIDQAEGPVVSYLTDAGVKCAEESGSDTDAFLQPQQQWSPGATVHQYNFGGVKGNVAAGSSDFSQTYTDNAFDVGRLREFADFILEVAGTLGLEPVVQAELEADARELQAAADDPAGAKGRWRKALDAVLTPLKLAGQTAVRYTAITMGNDISTDLMTYMHHLPHP